MHLRDYLIRMYQKKGWSVVNGFIEDNSGISVDWIGSRPDIFAIKGDRKIAVCIESETSPGREHLAAKWKSILKNPDISLVVYFRDKRMYELAVQTAEQYGIKMECKVIKRVERRKKANFESLFVSRMNLFILMAVLVAVFVSAFLLLPSVRKYTNIQDYYMPFDHQRQMESLKKEIEKARKR